MDSQNKQISTWDSSVSSVQKNGEWYYKKVNEPTQVYSIMSYPLSPIQPMLDVSNPPAAGAESFSTRNCKPANEYQSSKFIRQWEPTTSINDVDTSRSLKHHSSTILSEPSPAKKQHNSYAHMASIISAPGYYTTEHVPIDRDYTITVYDLPAKKPPHSQREDGFDRVLNRKLHSRMSDNNVDLTRLVQKRKECHPMSTNVETNHADYTVQCIPLDTFVDDTSNYGSSPLLQHQSPIGSKISIEDKDDIDIHQPLPTVEREPKTPILENRIDHILSSVPTTTMKSKPEKFAAKLELARKTNPTKSFRQFLLDNYTAQSFIQESASMNIKHNTNGTMSQTEQSHNPKQIKPNEDSEIQLQDSVNNACNSKKTIVSIVADYKDDFMMHENPFKNDDRTLNAINFTGNQNWEDAVDNNWDDGSPNMSSSLSTNDVESEMGKQKEDDMGNWSFK